MTFHSKIFAATLLAALTLPAQPQQDRRLIFSTYQGGDRNDDARSVAVDSEGNIYVAGETESRDLSSTPVGGQPLTAAVFKSYLTRYAPGGQKVMWRALIGGSSNTVVNDLALDAQGNVLVAGTTGARDLPLKNPVQDKHAGLNICFVMKFNAKGELLFSTYLGGERNDEGRALAVDSQGNVYLAGRASSNTFPVKNALQPAIGGGGDDGFIAKFTPDLKLAYATYLGGAASDELNDIAVGPDDSVYVTGETMSTGMATDGAYLRVMPSYSSFAARLTPQGDALVFLTYVGWRGGYTTARALTVDAAGRAYVVGHTSAREWPTTPNAMQPKFGGGMRDGFLLRLTADGKEADYLTYLGGSRSGPTDPDESVAAVAVDARGHVHLAGQTNSADFPGQRALQRDFAGEFDAYVLRLDLEGRQIIYSTFWGGQKRDAAQALALGPGEAVTLVGDSFSADLPVANALQTQLGSANDSFVAQLCDPMPGVWSAQQPATSFQYVRGGERPASSELVIYTGCPQPFEVTVAETGVPWLSAVADGRTAPMKLKLDVMTDGLEPGEYQTVLKVTVPDAFSPVMEIPVTLKVIAAPVVE